MKKLIIGAVLITAAYTIQSCSATRAPSGPAGAATPGYGSAANLSAGRTGQGVPNSGVNPAPVPGNATDHSAGSADSLSNKVDAAKDKVAQFINQASLSSHTRLEASRIASQQAKNNYVKSFASMALEELGKADADLMALAAAKNITLDSAANHKDRDDKVKQLSTVTGEELESVYIQMMTKEYEQAVALYEDEDKSKDPEVKAYADQYLPMLKLHLKSVSSLNKR
jgi:putative membrane protein